jgi:hypothetical protein
MTYQEKSIPSESLEKFLQVLDSDEGIRIDDKSGHIFINKTSKRYCINISKDNKDKFIYRNSVKETIDFLKTQINHDVKIFAY